MRKLVVAIVALLALFSLLRAYAQPAGGEAGAASGAFKGVQLHPGLIEVGDGSTSMGLSFGILERTADGAGRVNVLPLRLVLRSGDTNVSVGLGGLAFLLGSGASIGAPVMVTGLHRGDVISIGGPVTIDGRVEGDVWAVAAGVQLTGRAVVTGDVVAIGGTVTAAAGASVAGAVSQLPGLKIPLVGVLGTGFSAQALGLAGAALSYVLLGFALFISSYYFGPHARGLLDSMPVLWRPALITIAISLAAVPLLAALLVASVVGVFLLPVLALALFVLSLDGFLALCVRAGDWLRGSAGQATDMTLYLFTSGLLTLFLLKVPSLVGILLTATRWTAAARVGALLQGLGFALTAAGFLYGFGAAVAFARFRATGRQRA